MICAILLAIINLTGVVGDDLRARAFFDENNVNVGDPLILTLDFIGEAEFKDLHPPRLSSVIDEHDWKVDDKSAKTTTFDDARRLVYRVRPMREGVLYFPSLEFEYENVAGEKSVVRSNEIPVHAKKETLGEIAKVDEVEDIGFPRPPELITKADVELGRDEAFAWKRALARPSVEAFAQFEFPAARMNEVSLMIKEGNWAKAMKSLHRLEWEIGQTDVWETAMIAALALKYDNPSADLPVWRKVLRPLLKYSWKKRLAFSCLLLVGLLVIGKLLGKFVRAIAVVMILALPAFADDPFARMEQMMERQRQQMQNMMSFSFGGEAEDPIEVRAKVEVDKPIVSVGEEFHFIVSFDAPEEYSIGQVRITPSEMFGMKVTGKSENLDKRKLSIPVRYDVPLKTRLGFAIDGMVSGKRESKGKGRQFSFTFSNSFHVDAPKIALEVKPLEDAPSSFSGIIARNLELKTTIEDLKTEKDDVVRVVYRLIPEDGFVPKNYLPPDSAYEISRNRDGSIDYRRYWVNDGGEMPLIEIVYYNPETCTYEIAR